MLVYDKETGSLKITDLIGTYAVDADVAEIYIRKLSNEFAESLLALNKYKDDQYEVLGY